nr:MAG TPA: hypothetical protein [Caudoviricetes sp.]
MGKQEAFITPSILEWAINRAARLRMVRRGE